MLVEPKCGREMCSLISGTCECNFFDEEHGTEKPLPWDFLGLKVSREGLLKQYLKARLN